MIVDLNNHVEESLLYHQDYHPRSKKHRRTVLLVHPKVTPKVLSNSGNFVKHRWTDKIKLGFDYGGLLLKPQWLIDSHKQRKCLPFVHYTWNGEDLSPNASALNLLVQIQIF